MEQILIILVLTALFAIGGKIALHFKNREIVLLKEQFDRELAHARTENENVRATHSEDLLRQMKRIEEAYQVKLNEKEERIGGMVAEIEALKSWKEEIAIKMAEFKGASQGNPQMLIFKLMEHNQKLNRALLQKWENVEKCLSTELNGTLEKLRTFFREAEDLHRDGIEIISIYEARIPEYAKRKVRDEMLKLSSNTGVPEFPPK